MNILIVDDDIDLLEMVSLALRTNLMNVECLTKGNELFDKIPQFKPDVILLDIYLDDNDGRQLCNQLKTSSPFKNIPVILYSAGHITKQSVEESLADEFITKPFSIPQLVSTIKTIGLPGK